MSAYRHQNSRQAVLTAQSQSMSKQKLTNNSRHERNRHQSDVYETLPMATKLNLPSISIRERSMRQTNDSKDFRTYEIPPTASNAKLPSISFGEEDRRLMKVEQDDYLNGALPNTTNNSRKSKLKIPNIPRQEADRRLMKVKQDDCPNGALPNTTINPRKYNLKYPSIPRREEERRMSKASGDVCPKALPTTTKKHCMTQPKIPTISHQEEDKRISKASGDDCPRALPTTTKTLCMTQPKIPTQTLPRDETHLEPQVVSYYPNTVDRRTTPEQVIAEYRAMTRSHLLKRNLTLKPLPIMYTKEEHNDVGDYVLLALQQLTMTPPGTKLHNQWLEKLRDAEHAFRLVRGYDPNTGSQDREAAIRCIWMMRHKLDQTPRNTAHYDECTRMLRVSEVAYVRSLTGESFGDDSVPRLPVRSEDREISADENSNYVLSRGGPNGERVARPLTPESSRTTLQEPEFTNEYSANSAKDCAEDMSVRESTAQRSALTPSRSGTIAPTIPNASTQGYTRSVSNLPQQEVMLQRHITIKTPELLAEEPVVGAILPRENLPQRAMSSPGQFYLQIPATLPNHQSPETLALAQPPRMPQARSSLHETFLMRVQHHYREKQKQHISPQTILDDGQEIIDICKSLQSYQKTPASSITRQESQVSLLDDDMKEYAENDFEILRHSIQPQHVRKATETVIVSSSDDQLLFTEGELFERRERPKTDRKQKSPERSPSPVRPLSSSNVLSMDEERCKSLFDTLDDDDQAFANVVDMLECVICMLEKC